MVNKTFYIFAFMKKEATPQELKALTLMLSVRKKQTNQEKEVPLKVNTSFEELVKISVSGNPKPKKKVRKRK